MMNGCILNEINCLEHLLLLKLTPNLNWNSFIRPNAKDTAKNGQLPLPLQRVTDSLWHALSFQGPDPSKSRVLRPHMGWSCPILSCHPRLSSKVCLNGNELFPSIYLLYRLWLLYCHLHGRCSDKLRSLVPPVQLGPALTCTLCR